MIDQKTTNQEYPLPNPSNKLSEDVLRIQDTFEKIDIDVGILHTASTIASTEIDNIRNGSVWQVTSTGFGAAYQVALNPAPSALTVGQVIHMTAHVQNTGSATLDVNGLGVKTIKKTDGSDLKSGDIVTGAVCFLFYDGINFQLINPKVDQEQLEVVTSNLMLAFEEIQENHGGSLNMEAGWSDSFSNPNEQGADEANSSGYQHDIANTLYKGSDPGIGLNSDKDYDTEANYLQQEWTNTNQTSSQATVASGTTVTLSSGTWPTNCVNGHISFDNGSTWFDIASRDSDTSLSLDSTASDGTFDYTLRMSDFNNTSLGLSQKGITDLITINASGFDHDLGGDGWNWKKGQSFKATTSGPLSAVKFYIRKHPSYPNGGNGLTAYLASVSSASAIPTLNPTILATSNNVSHTIAMQPDYNQVTFTFPSPFNVIADSHYIIWLEQPGYNWASPYYAYNIRSSGANNNIYSDGVSLRRDGTHHNTWEDMNAQYGDNDLEVLIGDIPNYASSEYVSCCDLETQKTDTSAWSDINSGSVTETLNSQSAYYWLTFDPISNFGIGTEIKIFNPTNSVWRVIAKNNAGTWEYNNDSSNSATYTGVNATVNDILHAVSQAISTQAGNRMTGTNLAAITDVQWEETGGWSTSFNSIIRGVTLYSNSSNQNPSVSKYRINYDSLRMAMDLKSKAYDPGFVPSEAYVWARAEHSDSDGAGTFSVSRNSGAQWEVVPMTQQGLSFGDIRVMRGTVDLGAQPSGQDLRCRYQTTQGKDQFLHSWGLQAKA